MINIQLDKAYTCLSSNNFCLAIGGKGGVSVINHKQEITQIHANECHALSFSSSELLAVCNDKIVEIYDGQSKIWGSEKHVRRILDVDWNSAGLLATCSKDSKLYAWDPRMQEPAIVFAPTKGVGVHCLAWSRHSNDIIASGHETALKIWDARLPKKSVGTVRSAHPGRIIGLDWHHNSSNLLSNSLLSLVKTWKTTAVSINVVNSAQTHFQSIKTLFSPDDSRIVYTSENNDGKIHFLNTEDLKVHLSSNMGSSVEDLDWHGDSLAVLCADRVLKIIGFDNKENNDRGEMIEDFQDCDAFDCSMTIMNFEEEIKCMESNPKEGIFIENYGLGQRFCLIRIHNKKEFLKYMLNFPIDYPDSPPTYMLQASSKYLSTSAPEEIKRLETDLVKRSKKFCKAKGFSIQKICDFLLSQLNSITDIEGYEDFNDFLENILDYPSYPKNTPLTCIHAWHPSGDLLVFISSESTNNYAFEDIFDIESSHYQAGIHAEKFGPVSDHDMEEETSSIVKVIPNKNVLDELFRELAFSGDTPNEICTKNAKICEKHKLNDLAGIWLSFLPSWELIKDQDCWSVHPLGLKFLIKLLKYFWKTKNYYGQIFTSIYCVMCLEIVNTTMPISAEIEFNHVTVKDLMFFLLKELSEHLHRWNIMINSRAIMKLAGNLGNSQFLLSSLSSLGFDVVHNFTYHSKTFCNNCNKKNLICAICLGVVTSLGMFCKSCGHGGHLWHQQKWFYRESVCPAGCGCNCLIRMQNNSEMFFNRNITR